MHSNAFFNLIACVLFPTPLIPSMVISIPRMINKWVKRVQFLTFLTNLFLYNIVQHYINRIRCYSFIKYLLLYNLYRPIFGRSLQMAITKIKIISDATAAVLLKSCAAMYDVLIDKKFK
ncbi:pA118R [African swine fever virus]|uniref:Uncharacterized protein A118R n=5 Tax=African swine fever virus TaxID=10497 RepID=VF118_ASFB7|nr:pA118R precursor [African swine fever virus]YP_009702283.1 pA118R [African swine fever virus]YP_009702442.1 pA118R [African swine fever virus]YP_009702603.1 pA118R [African swine fever virus]YP_009703092.1 A118R [African swine fever virus]YP_009703275.1 pA118R [African swine fever virus]YP_009703644.1 pA118R [African swine fever virus OURT 88/3]YP_009703805.1 hypothetical protein F8224_gp042 [African swine fever virus E75]Q65139.1 RecName: Full=Uncharacterized protein A118R [African swin